MGEQDKLRVKGGEQETGAILQIPEIKPGDDEKRAIDLDFIIQKLHKTFLALVLAR